MLETSKELGESVNDTCNLATTVSEVDYEGEICWTTPQRAQLFSIVMWASLATGLPAGLIVDRCFSRVIKCALFPFRYGPKSLLIASMVLHMIGTFFLPLAATIHPYAAWPAILVRFVLGLGLVSEELALLVLRNSETPCQHGIIPQN